MSNRPYEKQRRLRRLQRWQSGEVEESPRRDCGPKFRLSWPASVRRGEESRGIEDIRRAYEMWRYKRSKR